MSSILLRSNGDRSCGTLDVFLQRNPIGSCELSRMLVSACFPCCRGNAPKNQYPGGLRLPLGMTRSSTLSLSAAVVNTHPDVACLVIDVQVLEETFLLPRCDLQHVGVDKGGQHK